MGKLDVYDRVDGFYRQPRAASRKPPRQSQYIRDLLTTDWDTLPLGKRKQAFVAWLMHKRGCSLIEAQTAANRKFGWT